MRDIMTVIKKNLVDDQTCLTQAVVISLRLYYLTMYLLFFVHCDTLEKNKQTYIFMVTNN